MTGNEIRRVSDIATSDTDSAQRAAHDPQNPVGSADQPRLVPGVGSRAMLFRYLLIGGLSIVIDVSLLYTLHSIVGVQLGISTTVAFLTSLVFNFTCNRLMMAGSETEQLMRHAFRYGLLVVANLAITVAVVTGAQHLGVPYLVGKLAVVAASTCWNFVLYRRWVFA